jgi:non-specific serine/threonine protein kinase/serine/threonine-protein kinase
MERVEGLPLGEYCDRNRLSIRQRIELLILVCQAVHHAHRKGVLHRDLKPSNILVSESSSPPAPKIIDFGIAKAVAPEMPDPVTEYTRAGQALGTPAYMSPEQAGFGGAAIDAQTDVYSLGVILYELFTGCLPASPVEYGYAGFMQLLARGELGCVRPSARIAEFAKHPEIAASRSSTAAGLKRQLQGDIDWIVMKALEVDRSRRYASVEALSEDLRRYLAGIPVTAHPPALSYQIAKFVHRHRVPVAAACLVTLALVSGTVAATVGFVRASRAETAARQDALASRQVSDFLVQLFSLANTRQAPGKPASVRELVERGAAGVENDLKDQPAVQAKLFATLSQVYEAMGQYEDSRKFAGKSLALPQPQGRDGELQTAAAVSQLGSAHQRLGNIQEARRLYEKALEIRLRVLGENDLLVARSLNTLGHVDCLMEHFDQAASAHRRALAIQRKAGGPYHRDTANSLRGLALIEDRKGNIEAGLALFRSALEIFEKNFGPNHPVTAGGLQDVAVSLKTLERPHEAQPLLERSLAILKQVNGPGHPQVSFTEHSLGLCLMAQGKRSEALPYLEDAFRIRMAAMGPDNPRTADTAESLAMLQVDLGRLERARILLEQALRAHLRSYGPNHSSTLETRKNLARTLVKEKRYREALPHLSALAGRDVPAAFRIDLRDPFFEPVRRVPAFRRLLAETASSPVSAPGHP